ncbi:aldehyde oxidase GLOX-like [Lycium ferocissimum]|uniref:aldehyde oxidase GLOX-like n=1 Tax=Lycium ferocissimum TaxID=112874 RepID=UPI002815EE8A|nr:aldehyde oxidase GLOX-like [Lycium ferocissimum]
MGLIKIQSFSFLFTILIITSSSLSHQHHHSRSKRHNRRNSQLNIYGPSFYTPSTTLSGEWVLLHDSIGISAMHMQLLYNNKVVIFDRTDFGASNLSLPNGKCRYNDEALPNGVDCTAHSILYDVLSNTYRPLMVQTDVWCSSGAVNSNGTLIQTGGYHAGDRKIRFFSPCNDGDDSCDWTELEQNLTVQRWYSSDHLLPDGRVIIVGGRRAFSYEFFPKNGDNNEVFDLPFLKETTDPKEENNLYPFLYILPDGNLYIFANQRSIVLDYVNNKVLKEFPVIPGEKRSYPATGSSVMLPLILNAARVPTVEVMICGGAWGGAYVNAMKGVFWRASNTCGRMRITDPDPKWVMEDMPMGRVMPDMLLLPTGDVIILNGASNGAAGWENAVDPVLNPVLYKLYEPDPDKRFLVLNPSNIPRMYHSSATLLPDGRILVGGSNPHVRYNFTGVKYPTELSVEAFSPPYLAIQYSPIRPSIIAVEGQIMGVLSYGQQFSITFTLGYPGEELMVSMVAPSFTTHSFGMNQRLLFLEIVDIKGLSMFNYKVTMFAPTSKNIAPPGYYMVFVVHQGVPSYSVWVRLK